MESTHPQFHMEKKVLQKNIQIVMIVFQDWKKEQKIVHKIGAKEEKN